jgi:hypothetical protein
MNITPRRQALFLLLAASILAASGAAAQDDGGGRIRLEGPSWTSAARGSFLLHPCASDRGIAFCLGDVETPPSPAAKKFTAFTRLAGMFMGRVEALQIGDWRVRFILDLR